jgi:flagellar basal-body rod protein FlgF
MNNLPISANRLYTNDGLGISIRAMQAQTKAMNVHTDNIANFGVPGYQRKRPVILFREHIDATMPKPEEHPILTPTVDTAVDTEIGRLRKSGLALDVALATKGYFQKMDENGVVELTRDGRFTLDHEGWMRGMDGRKVLSAAGTPLRFTTLPREVEKEVKISRLGDVQLYNPSSGKVTTIGRLGIANRDGGPTETPEVRQGFVEDSNVILQEEYVAFMPARREFEANRQLFIIQNDALSRMIQELGRTQ